MAARQQKGSRRPGKTDNPRRHDRGGQPRKLEGGVPWPEYADGTPYTDGHKRVTHAELTEEAGTVQWVEWVHPDGTFMDPGKRSRAATKTRPEKTHPGRWDAVVSWDGRDQPGKEALTARHPLAHLRPLL